jgi:hypothetical protein
VGGTKLTIILSLKQIEMEKEIREYIDSGEGVKRGLFIKKSYSMVTLSLHYIVLNTYKIMGHVNMCS